MNIRRHPRTAAALAAVGLTAVMMTAGCASSAQSGSSTSSAGDLQPVNVGIGSASNQSAEILVAQDLGLFEKNGLDVNLVQLNGSGQVPTAMKGGSIDIGAGDATSMAVNMLKGIDIVYFGGNINDYTLELWARPGITDVKDLKGKTFGSAAPGSLTDLALTDVLDEAGLTRDDIKIVNFQDATAKIAALASGAIDAMLTQPPSGGEQLKKAGATVIYDASTLPNLTESYVTTPSYAKANPEVLEAFLKATREADVLLKTAPDQVIPVVSKYTKVTDEALNQHGFDFFKGLFTIDPSVQQDLLDKAFDSASESTGVDLSTVDVSSFYDDSAVQALTSAGFISDTEAQAK